MKNTFIAIVVSVSLFLVASPVMAQPANCQQCLDAGNTPAECAGLCGGVLPGDGALNPPDDAFDPLQGPTQETFDTLNPLRISGSNDLADDLSTPGGIVSRLLDFSFPIAGLILFIMLVWGGFEILLGAANKKMVDAGRQRITAALIGFILLFTSYWIMRIIEQIFGIAVL